MEDRLARKRGANVLTTHTMGESRTVDVMEVPHGVEVWEETFGPVTESFYGTSSHVRKLAVGREALRRIASLRGQDEGDPVAAVGGFFVSGGKTLSDLEDWLDNRGVPYESTVPEGAKLCGSVF